MFKFKIYFLILIFREIVASKVKTFVLDSFLAHCIGLMLEDIGKMPIVGRILKRAMQLNALYICYTRSGEYAEEVYRRKRACLSWCHMICNCLSHTFENT